MIMIHQLKPGNLAQLVLFETSENQRKQYETYGIKEGCVLQMISCFGRLTFSIESRIFSVSTIDAKTIRGIKLIEQY